MHAAMAVGVCVVLGFGCGALAAALLPATTHVARQALGRLLLLLLLRCGRVHGRLLHAAAHARQRALLLLCQLRRNGRDDLAGGGWGPPQGWE